MAQVTLRNTKGTPLTYTEVDNNFKFCDSDTNLIINGGLNVWQRGTTFTPVANSAYTADRFSYAKVSTAVQDIIRSTDVPTQAQAGVKTNFSLHADVTTADTVIAAGDLVSINYRIEGYDYSQVEGNTYTLSFWVKGTKTGIHCISFSNAGQDRSYIAEYTINSTNTWEYKTIPVTFDYSGGTWDYTNGVGLRIGWTLMAGSTFQTTADSWQTGNFIATSNQVNAVDSTANDFRIALVKFEPGSEATQFRFRHFERELSLCQRYYWKSFPTDTTPAQNAGRTGGLITVASGSDGRFSFMVSFPSSMRTTPTVVLFNPSAANVQARNVIDNTDAPCTFSAELSENKLTIVNNVNDASDDGDFIVVHATADAEL